MARFALTLACVLPALACMLPASAGILPASALLLPASAFLLPASAVAQEFGRVTVDGREVVLFENGSWTFASEAPGEGIAGCARTVASRRIPVAVCLDAAAWQRDADITGYEHVYQHRQRELFFGIIPERSGYELAGLKTMILGNARGVDGVADVTEVRDESVTLNGVPWRMLKMTMTVDGGDIVFWNYYTTRENWTVQAAFWTTAQHEDEVEPVAAAVATTLTVTD